MILKTVDKVWEWAVKTAGQVRVFRTALRTTNTLTSFNFFRAESRLKVGRLPLGSSFWAAWFGHSSIISEDGPEGSGP